MTLLVDWLWQGTAVALLARLLVRLISPRAAATRHRVWWVAFALVLLLPAWRLVDARLANAQSAHAPAALLPYAPALTDPASAAAAAPAIALVEPPDWAMLGLALIWGVAVSVALLRLAWSWRAVTRLISDAAPLGAREARLRRWSALRHEGRQPRLRVSAHLAGACAGGLWRPTILVSRTLVEALDDRQLDAVVLHELAHLERYDDWSTLVRRAVGAIAGFHPGIWLIGRQIEMEMEAACDERVVARTGDPSQYALHLLDVAAVTGRLRSPLAVPGSSAHMPTLRSRVERLAAAVQREPAGRQGLAAVACVSILAAAGGGAASVPSMVVFAEEPVSSLPAVATRQRPVPSGLRAVVPSEASVSRRPAVPTRGLEVRTQVVAASPVARVAVPPADVPVLTGAFAGQTGPPVAEDVRLPEARERPRVTQVSSALPVAGSGGLPVASAARDSATRISRAAQSTAGAFTRLGLAVASRF